MGYLGNRNGPAKSEIVSRLGNAYFGISDLELAEEIEIYLEEEGNGEVDPVRIDDSGRLFIVFRAPGNKLQRFYLDEFGYKLTGRIRAIIDEKEKEIEL